MPRSERGMVTAELAVCLPVLVLVLGLVLSAVSVASAQLRVQDAAREAARAAARADLAHAHDLARRLAPGAAVSIATRGGEVDVVATERVRVLAGWLPSFEVHDEAVALVEPGS